MLFLPICKPPTGDPAGQVAGACASLTPSAGKQHLAVRGIFLGADVSYRLSQPERSQRPKARIGSSVTLGRVTPRDKSRGRALRLLPALETHTSQSAGYSPARTRAIVYHSPSEASGPGRDTPGVQPPRTRVYAFHSPSAASGPGRELDPASRWPLRRSAGHLGGGCAHGGGAPKGR